MGIDLAGSAFIAGMITRFVIAPLDVIKIRSQVTSSSAFPIKGQVKTIFEKEGLFGFWKGNASAELLYGSYSLVQMTTYKKLRDSRLVENGNLNNFISGALAGMLATAITFPFDVLRTRFAIQTTPVYISIPHAISTILKEEKFGFFKGLTPSLIAIVPYMGITFASYEYYRKILTKSESKFNTDLLSGALAGFSGKLATYPLDTLRKRMQVQGPRLQDFLHTIELPNYVKLRHQTNSFMSSFAVRIIQEIYRKEGMKGFYRGVKPALIKAVIGSALTFSLTNFLK